MANLYSSLQARPNLLGIVCWVLGCLPAWSWLGTSLSAGTRLAVCPGLVAVGFSLSVRQLHRAVPLQEPWALGPLQPVGAPTGLACTTAAASSALQVSARSSSGEGRAGVTGPSPETAPFLLQPRAPTWVESCLLPGATSWMLDLQQLCVWRWCILMPQG